MINLFDQPRRYLKLAIIVFAALLVLLVFLAVLGWHIPWFALAWWQAPSPQQIGMLRWDQQGLPAPVPAAPGESFTPTYSDAAYDGSKLWVTYSKSKGENGFVISYDPLSGKWGKPIEVGIDPGGVIFDGQHIWAANRGSKSLSCIDLTGNSSASTETAGLTATAAATAEDLKARPWDLKASDGSNDANPITPTYLAFDGEHIWVTDREGNAVWRLPAGSCDRPTTDYSDTRITKVNGMEFSQPFGIIFDGTYIWIANRGSNKVMRLNPDDCNGDTCREAVVMEAGDATSQPSNLAYDGTFVWVTLNGTDPGQVARLHARTGQGVGNPVIGEPIKVSEQPIVGNPLEKPKPCSHVNRKLDGIAFDGKYIWIASNTGWVCQLRAVDTTPAAEFRAAGTASLASNHGDAASRIAFDGLFIWVIVTDGTQSSFTRR